MADIRDGRLYRETHDTFEDYCRKRWDMTRQRAHQFIEAAEVRDVLSTNVDILPVNEAQSRPLAPLAPEQQRAAWNEAVTASGGSPTAALVLAAGMLAG